MAIGKPSLCSISLHGLKWIQPLHKNLFANNSQRLSSIQISRFNYPLFLKISFLFLFILTFTGNLFSTETLTPDTPNKIRAKISDEKNTVEITWEPPSDEGEVIIARSKSIIDTPEKLFIADSLGIVSYKDETRINSYKDINLRPGQYYYAVALVNSVRRRQVQMVQGGNFTTAPVTIFENENSSNSTVDVNRFIKSIELQKVDTGVRITWEAPEDSQKTKPIYSVYRSNSPLNTIQSMRNAKKMIELDHPDSSYTDRSREALPGVYYGVSVTIKDDEFIPLQDSVSYKRYGTESPKKKKVGKNEDLDDVPSEDEEDLSDDTPKSKTKKKSKKKSQGEETIPSIQKPAIVKDGYYVHDINYELEKDTIHLSWSHPKDVELDNIVYTIYQSNSPLKNIQELKSSKKVKKLGELDYPERKFKIKREEKKKIYYYGVTVMVTSGEEFFLLEENDSFLKVFPEGVKNSDSEKQNDKEPESPDKSKSNEKEHKEESKKKSSDTNTPIESDEFNWIMSEYYKKGKFTVAHEKLILLAETSEDVKDKGKAYFYAALCQYNKKKYKEALKLLLKDEVQKNYDGDRVQFYINQCLKKRSDG
jgi:hypothetical protein